MYFMGKDEKGRSVSFERADVYQITYQLVVEFFGEREAKHPKDGMTEKHEKFLKAINGAIHLAYRNGYNQATQDINERIIERNNETTKDLQLAITKAAVDCVEEEKEVLSAWTKVE